MVDFDMIEREEILNEIIEKVKKFLCNGCGCLCGFKGGLCFIEIKEEVVMFNLNNCFELMSGEFDLIILVNI